MKKFLIILLIITAMLSYFTYKKYISVSKDSPHDPVVIDIDPQDNIPTSDNFPKIEGVIDLGSGLYSLEEKLLNEGKGFSVLYSSNNNSYTVAITKLPLNVHREEAGKYFLDLLNIDEATACKMNVYVGVAASISAAYSSKDLKFSFCPGAVKL